MKKAILSVLLFTFLSCSKTPIDLLKENGVEPVNGKVSKVTEMIYLELRDNGGKIETVSLSGIKEINYKDGKMQSYYRYDFNRKPLEKVTFKYDELGNLIRETKYAFSKFNDDNDISLEEYTTFKYDADGKMIHQEITDSYEQITYSADYKYDEIGQLIEKKEFTLGGSRYKSKYNWNDSENIEVANYHEEQDKLIYGRKEILTYEQGLLAEKAYFFMDSTKTLSIGSRIKYKYNKKKQLIESNEFDSNKKLINTNEYLFEDYDDDDNWLKKTMLMNGKALSIIERKIEYGSDESEESLSTIQETPEEKTSNDYNEKPSSYGSKTCSWCNKTFSGNHYTHLGKLAPCQSSEDSNSIGKYCSMECCSNARKSSCPTCY